ncbi:MAG: hypothetical protein AAB547_02900 [Patescibacteria group bacterium]
MNDKQVFEHLFLIASQSKDPRGIVAACLVSNNEIIASAASSDDGILHAEDILFQEVQERSVAVPQGSTLYATLIPCSKRTTPGMVDCVSPIVSNKISSVVYGASDPDQAVLTKERLSQAGIRLRQVSDSEIIKRCAEIFNASVTEEHRNTDVKLKPTE